MTANPLIDQYAAEVRKLLASQSSATRRETRNVANRVAGEFRNDLSEVPDEVIGAVLLRAASLVGTIWRTTHGSTALDAANALAAAGERLYHHPEPRAELASDETGGLA